MKNIRLEDIPGNMQVKERLQRLLPHIPNTLLFEGPRGVGKGKCAHAFANMVLKSTKKEHPDFCEIFPEGKSDRHPISTIRTLIQESRMPPFESDHRIFLVHHVDRMLSISMDALLKTLEEPIPTTITILITSHVENLPSTITSRCFTLAFSSLAPQHYDKRSATSESAFNLGVSLLKREYLPLKEYEDLQSGEEILCYLLFFYRDIHLLKIGGNPSFLFYWEKEATLRHYLSCPTPPLEEIQQTIETMARANELHIPISHSLYMLL